MNICNIYNVTTIPITKCEIIKKKKKKNTNKQTNKHTHTLKLKTCQTLKTFMTHLSSTTKQLKLSIILPNHNLPNLEENKKKHFPIYFFHEKQRKEKLWSLYIIFFPICYTNDIYKSKGNVLRDQIRFVIPSG